MKGYVLSTTPEEMPEFEKVYLQGKNFHLSYITPFLSDALIFDSKKTARKFLEHHKMMPEYWLIEKIKT